ncbi:hypothetical protein PMIN01_05785 [Paraphaeosphaeria minitans]|uniref:Uncharacterized protein n=1 Tax=Paraphaeosphaeria minitans TaxID=565426 RepID=A0A9P6GJ11_9PLEO|nr:hypothetical protein PMIN01_05785 [Paraphaeosphaeria minitans]
MHHAPSARLRTATHGPPRPPQPHQSRKAREQAKLHPRHVLEVQPAAQSASLRACAGLGGGGEGRGGEWVLLVKTDTVRYGTARCGAVRCGAVRCGAVGRAPRTAGGREQAGGSLPRYLGTYGGLPSLFLDAALATRRTSGFFSDTKCFAIVAGYPSLADKQRCRRLPSQAVLAVTMRLIEPVPAEKKHHAKPPYRQNAAKNRLQK